MQHPAMPSRDPSQFAGFIPAVTDRMKQAVAEVLAGATEMPAEELVTLIYRAMALGLSSIGPGDPL